MLKGSSESGTAAKSESETAAKSESETAAKSEIGRVWYDFFSWGHIAMGLTTFMISYWIDLSTRFPIPAVASFIVVLVTAWVWELIENNFLVFSGVKHFDKKDSLNNSLFDIMFVAIGGLFLWFVEGIIIWSGGEIIWLFLIGFHAIVACLFIMYLTRSIYYKRHPK